MQKPEVHTVVYGLGSNGHNFTGPGNECHYCGYELDECLRYDFNCEAMQRLNLVRASNNLVSEFKFIRKELECLRQTIRNQ